VIRTGSLLVASSLALTLACEVGPAASGERDDGPADVEVRDAAPGEGAGPGDAGSPAASALLLDLEMRDPIAWTRTVEALTALGYEVTYRRAFAHFTEPDAGRFDLVVLAAGAAPGGATDWLRAPEVDRLAGYVRGGGALVLAARNRWRDGLESAFDGASFNAVLRALGVGLRVDANTLVGAVVPPAPPLPPLHQTVPWGYVGPRERTLLLPVAFPVGEAALGTQAPFAAGWSPGLACEDDQVTPLARSHAEAVVWWQLGGAEADRVERPGSAQPLAAVAPAGDGWVAVLPRALLELSTLPSDGGARPSLLPALLDGTEAFVAAALGRLDALRRRTDLYIPVGCRGGRTLAQVDAEPVVEPPGPPLPERPPNAADWASVPEASEQTRTQVPSWFRRGRVRAVYGDLVEATRGHLERAREAGVDLVVSSTGAAALRDYTAGDEPPASVGAADVAGLRWFLGSVYRNDAFAGGDFETATDATGRPTGAPPPLDPRWWAEGVAPVVLGAARIAASHPHVGGISLDTELHGAANSMYAAGHGYESSAWAVVTEAIAEHDAGLAEKARALSVTSRLPWLVGHGLAPFAWRALEGAVADLARGVREEARALAPDLELALYVPSLQTSWFYRGLMRGWGTPERPVLVLSYDAAPAPVRDALAREGIHVRTLGGVLGVRLTARDLETALHTAGAGSDGFWLFQYRDFAPDTDPAQRHDPVDAYWAAVRAAGERLP